MYVYKTIIKIVYLYLVVKNQIYNNLINENVLRSNFCFFFLSEIPGHATSLHMICKYI